MLTAYKASERTVCTRSEQPPVVVFLECVGVGDRHLPLDSSVREVDVLDVLQSDRVGRAKPGVVGRSLLDGPGRIAIECHVFGVGHPDVAPDAVGLEVNVVCITDLHSFSADRVRLHEDVFDGLESGVFGRCEVDVFGRTDVEFPREGTLPNADVFCTADPYVAAVVHHLVAVDRRVVASVLDVDVLGVRDGDGTAPGPVVDEDVLCTLDDHGARVLDDHVATRLDRPVAIHSHGSPDGGDDITDFGGCRIDWAYSRRSPGKIIREEEQRPSGMDRRTFLRGVGGLGATAAFAGCLGILGGGGSSPPPRKSSVFEGVRTEDGKLMVSLESAESLWIESRADVNARLEPSNSGGNDPLGAVGDAIGSLNPVGVASAGGRGGRGATGRGSRSSYAGAPTGTHGRAKYHGGDGDDYDDWRDNNASDIDRYRNVSVAAVAVARIGNQFDEEEDLPGAGEPPGGWDQRMDLSAGESAALGIDDEGWYRVGAKLTADGGSHDFGWEAVDAQVEGSAGAYDVDQKWKISPRL